MPEREIVNVHQLNQRLRDTPQGRILRIENATIMQTMAESLFVAIEIPANVDLEFHNVEFEGDHFFRQAFMGRLVFFNCQIKGRRFEFTKCNRGFISFIGRIDLAFGLSFEECDSISFHVSGLETVFVVHPEWQAPAGFPTTAISLSINISVKRSSGSFLVRDFRTDLIFQVWNSHLEAIDIQAIRIKLLQFLMSDLNLLRVDWVEFDRFDCGSADIKSLEVNFEKLRKLPVGRTGTLNRGIDSASLESLARTYKRSGQISRFVTLYSRAGSAIAYARRRILQDEYKKSVDTKFLMHTYAWLKSRLGSVVVSVEDAVINRWLKRFYSPFAVFVIQVAVIHLFAAAYFADKDSLVTGQPPTSIQCFRESIYFSAVTFLTIGYGDILPTGSLQWVAVVEGFVGLLLGLMLAIVASRRYTS